MVAKRLSVLVALALLGPSLRAQDSPLGLFEEARDIGDTGKAGSTGFDQAAGRYTIRGSGENMWSTTDAFQFLWRKMSGDVALAADIGWIGEGSSPHRKACLIIRQSLDPDSPYVDAALHGDGLTSLQFRETKGGMTREIQSRIEGPVRVQIEKTGDYFTLSITPKGGALQGAGGSVRLEFKEPFYVGLGVCSHGRGTLETAVFSKVELSSKAAVPAVSTVARTLETMDIESGDRKVVLPTKDAIEAPNWSRDGKTLIFNKSGRLYRLPVEGGEPEPIDTGAAIHCNNDHGLSPDGSQLAISNDPGDGRASVVYTLPSGGGEPKLITPKGPSYWHGWSPDGRTLAYVGRRDGEFDIYAVPATGGEEVRLTTSKGLDDGPDYSADGRYIYYNSYQTGRMQIWRMKADGSEPEQLTSDSHSNWFPHPSPDGKWVVFISYVEDQGDAHPANKDVMLRIMPAAGGEPRVLAKFFGGQGSINVPSWSPDSRRIALVSFLRPAADR